ncbi:MAG: hypothetical protein WC412_06180, partial [Candidatus Omnitrophota bacterium]
GIAAVNVIYAGENLGINESVINAAEFSSSFGIAANVLIAANGSMFVNDSSVNAYAETGLAANVLYAGNNMAITDSSVTSSASLLAASVLIASNDMTINNSTVSAQADTIAATVLFAGNNMTIADSSVTSNATTGLAVTALIALNDMTIDGSNVSAIAGLIAATVLYAGNDMAIADSSVTSSADLLAVSVLIASNDMTINNSTVSAQAQDGLALNLLIGDDVTVSDSTITAQALNGHIAINGIIGNAVAINDSNVSAYAGNSIAVNAIVGNDVSISNSNIYATANSGLAANLVIGLNNVTVNNSDIQAEILTDGIAANVLYAGNNLSIVNGSNILANAVDGFAVNALIAGEDIDIRNSTVGSYVENDGIAVIGIVSLNGAVTIADSLIDSEVGGDGYAFDVISSKGNIALSNSTISALVDGTGNSAVILLAWNGSILADSTSLVRSEYGYFFAQYDIGTAASPINTDLDYVAGYSWDRGSIYINEANDIQLGFLLPIFGHTLGFSLAANNGVIHVVSGGDMVVNSVVSARGGVYLESTNGSIFAGQGWWPQVSGPQVTLLYGSTLYMDLTGTEWQTVGGVDYFTPIVIDPTLNGPNVIAGGFSYFSTPKGTIGVGTVGQDLTDPLVIPDNNPLRVNIQAFNSLNSAVPAGFIPAAGLAGLTLNIGGSSAYTINTGDGNGPIGISGNIEGIVRPGVVADTGVYPSPDIDFTSYPSPLNPPGYVFYNDTDIYGAALIGEAASNLGALQIWPPFRFDNPVGLILAQSLIRGPGYYEIINPARISSLDNFRPEPVPYFYGYHPLTPMDYTAFDNINLDIGAYDFINDNLNLKDTNKLYPFYEEDLKKKKPATI